MGRLQIHILTVITCCIQITVNGPAASGQDRGTGYLYNPDSRIAAGSYSSGTFSEIMQAMDASKYNPDSCYNLIYQAYQRSIGTTDHLNLFQSAFFLGLLHSVKGEYNEAQLWFLKAIEASAHTNLPLHHLCRAINNMGNIFHFQGDYVRAIEYYFNIIPIAERAIEAHPVIANPLARIYTSTAMVLFPMQDYHQALHYLNKAERLAEKYLDLYSLAPIYAHKGQIYGHIKDIGKARHYNNLALQSGLQINHEEVRFIALYNMSLLCDTPSQALSYLRRAQEIPGNINAYYRILATVTMGTIFLAEKDYAAASHYLHRADSFASKYNMPKTQLEINRNLAELHARTGNYRKAYEHHINAYMLNDSLLNKEKTLAINTLEIKYRTAQKDMDLSRKQLFIHLQEQKISRNNVVIGISAMGILLLTSISLFLFVLNRNNRHKQSLQLQRIRSLEQEQEIRELKAVMTGEERERGRLARELHDGIGGMVAAIKMNFSALKKQYTITESGNAEHKKSTSFAKIMDLINTTGNEIRETAHNLMPDILTRHGIEEALNLYCTKINNGGDVYIKLQIESRITRIPQNVQLSLYRIIQELVQNIIKHASATIAMIRISLSDDGVVHVLIRDNGKGFAPGLSAEGIGLQNVQSRVKVLHGTLSVTSALKEGTTVEIRIQTDNPEHIEA